MAGLALVAEHTVVPRRAGGQVCDPAGFLGALAEARIEAPYMRSRDLVDMPHDSDDLRPGEAARDWGWHNKAPLPTRRLSVAAEL
jgi:hypothetical protein